jgi:hypothetical protein
MGVPAHEAASINLAEREKSIEKDDLQQVEVASGNGTRSPLDEEAVHITAKTWWVIFVGVFKPVRFRPTDDITRFYRPRLACLFGREYDSDVIVVEGILMDIQCTDNVCNGHWIGHQIQCHGRLLLVWSEDPTERDYS